MAPVPINFEKGLKNLGDNPEMYRLVLQEYWKENQSTLGLLETAIQEKRYDEARQIVHKVKGSSGSIGAEELYKICVTLQKAFETKDEPVIEEESQKFREQLPKVLLAIEKSAKG